MSAESPKGYPVVYDSEAGLQYGMQNGYVTIPEAPINSMTTLTGDVTAGGPGAAAATLATVNSNVGNFTNANITVNGKGLVTAAASGSAPTTYSAGTGLTLTGTTFSQTVQTVTYSAGTGLTLTGTTFSQTVPTVAAPSVVDSSVTYSSGQAIIDVTVAGLLTTSTIWSVTQVTPGGSNLPLLGWTMGSPNGHLNLIYVGDPSGAVVVRVVFKL